MANQKLSITARIAKAKRDKAYAMSENGKKKKRESEKKRRDAKKDGRSISGKDYDHKRGRFVSVKSNRGNEGKGTKKEGDKGSSRTKK
jgi:hypothetical protein